MMEVQKGENALKHSVKLEEQKFLFIVNGKMANSADTLW